MRGWKKSVRWNFCASLVLIPGAGAKTGAGWGAKWTAGAVWKIKHFSLIKYSKFWWRVIENLICITFQPILFSSLAIIFKLTVKQILCDKDFDKSEIIVICRAIERFGCDLSFM